MRVRTRKYERVRARVRENNWGMDKPLVLLELRIPVHAAGEVSMKALYAMLKLDFIMNIMGSH